MTDSTRLQPNQVVALRSHHHPDRYLGHASTGVRMTVVRTAADQHGTAFVVRPGLAGLGISLEALYAPGCFLRHASFRLELHAHDGSALFAQDASFVQRDGLDGAGLSLESTNFPGAFIRQTAEGLTLEGARHVAAAVSFDVEAAPVPLRAGSSGRVRRFALILGADEYFDPRLENLEGCRNDVIDAAVTLIDKGLVAPEDLTPVASPTVSREELATRLAPWGADPAGYAHRFGVIHSHNMRPCFLRWAAHDLRRRMDAARAAGETPMLFLFWSGHGGLVGGEHLSFRLPGYQPGEDLRDHPGLPEAIRGLPEEEFNRTDITYDALIELLGLRKDESVFAVIGSCHAGAVLEGVAGEDRPADMIFTAGGVDTTLRERYLGGRWRGLLNWSILRVLEQFEVQADASLEAGMDLSFGQLLQTIRAMVLAMQGNTATAWLPQVRGALQERPELLGHRVGQVFTAAAGETRGAASCLGDGIEWPPGTTGYIVSEKGSPLGSICVSTSGELRLDTALKTRLFDTTSSTALDFAVRTTAPTPLGSEVYTSSDLDGPATVSAQSTPCFEISQGSNVVGYLVPEASSGDLAWYVVDDSQFLQTVNSKTYLKSDMEWVLSPVSSLPAGTYRHALDKPV